MGAKGSIQAGQVPPAGSGPGNQGYRRRGYSLSPQQQQAAAAQAQGAATQAQGAAAAQQYVQQNPALVNTPQYLQNLAARTGRRGGRQLTLAEQMQKTENRMRTVDQGRLATDYNQMVMAANQAQANARYNASRGGGVVQAQGTEQRMAGQAPAELTDAAYQEQLAQGRADFQKGLQGSKQALTAEQAAFRAQIDKEHADRAARLATRNEAYLARLRANQAAAKGGGQPAQTAGPTGAAAQPTQTGGTPLTADQLAQQRATEKQALADREAAYQAKQTLRTQQIAEKIAKDKQQSDLRAADFAQRTADYNAAVKQHYDNLEKTQKERAALAGAGQQQQQQQQQPPKQKQDNRVSAVKKARTVKQIQAAPVQQAAAAAAAPAPSIGTVPNPSLM